MTQCQVPCDVQLAGMLNATIHALTRTPPPPAPSSLTADAAGQPRSLLEYHLGPENSLTGSYLYKLTKYNETLNPTSLSTAAPSLTVNLLARCVPLLGYCHAVLFDSSSSRSSDGNSSLPDEGGSASQIPQASVQLAGYGSVVWPDSLSEWFVGGAGLQQISVVWLPVPQGHCSVWPMRSLEYRWQLRRLWPVLSLNTVTCSRLVNR